MRIHLNTFLKINVDKTVKVNFYLDKKKFSKSLCMQFGSERLMFKVFCNVIYVHVLPILAPHFRQYLHVY